MTVRNWHTSLREKLVYITPDGEVFNFHSVPSNTVVEMKGWGIPKAQISSTKGPFQHGENVLGVRVPPRHIDVLYRYNGCNREEYLAHRSSLVNFFRLNRTSVNAPQPGKLRWYRADGTIIQADVFLPELSLNPRSDGWDNFGISESLSFIAYNPVLYDPNQLIEVSVDYTCTLIQELTFPFSFVGQSLVFGGENCYIEDSILINYMGNWQEYPTIVITGPASNFSITHATTDLVLALDYDIVAGETVTFDLTYGRKSVRSSLIGSLLGYLSTDSSLGSFAIEPDPLVPNGANLFSVYIEDGSADTSVIIQYFNRYIGV